MSRSNLRDERHLSQIEQIGIVPVATVRDAEHALPLARALLQGGLTCVEVTFRTDVAADVLLLIHDRFPEILLGAGTITTARQVDIAAASGAAFVVSPGLDPVVVRRGRALGLTVIPGICTPTELQAAVRLGLEVVKFFPAEAIGGPALLRALAGPFPGVRYIPTGGISPSNLGIYLEIPAVLACGGSWMVAPELLQAGAWDRVRELTSQAILLVRDARASPAPVRSHGSSSRRRSA